MRVKGEPSQGMLGKFSRKGRVDGLSDVSEQAERRFKQLSEGWHLISDKFIEN